MAVTDGPKIPVMIAALAGDSYLAPGNQFLRMFQALIQANVIEMDLTAPPASPSNGAEYIVASGGTGAWAGHDNEIAYWTTDDPNNPTGIWEFWTPTKGWCVGNQADHKLYTWTGTAWQAVGIGTVAFEVNGTPISDQNTVNFVDGTGTTVSNPTAGEIQIDASGGGGAVALLNTDGSAVESPFNHIVAGVVALDGATGSATVNLTGDAVFGDGSLCVGVATWLGGTPLTETSKLWIVFNSGSQFVITCDNALETREVSFVIMGGTFIS